MKMRLLDYAILCALSGGIVAPAFAQTIALPGGGAVRAVEDPVPVEPTLSVSMVAAPGKPIVFEVATNYADFIAKAEVLVLHDAKVIARVPVSIKDGRAQWTPTAPHDDVVVRVYDKDGRFDESFPAGASAKTPRIQNLALRGSRVRLLGSALPKGARITIDGRAVTVDPRGEFLAEYLVPIGKRRFDIAGKPLEVDVTGRYVFATGIAEMSTKGAPTADNTGVSDYEGRLAFFAKGKLRGRYLFTAQADTNERDLEHLFDGFLDARPRDVFRRLDADHFYPTYGDDSTTVRDADSMGRPYLRVEWDRNQALWGNFDTGFSGSETGQYARSLYGAAVHMRSRDNTSEGEPATLFRGFVAQSESAHGHDEFLGTGGSLYYLKRTDVLAGSDNVVLEVRDPLSGRVHARTRLARGADYEIDELQGRLLLTRPLAQVTREQMPLIGRDAPLDGLQQVLLVDYEFVPSGFTTDAATDGVRAKHWFGDHVAIGRTHVDENRVGADYTLDSIDVTLQADGGTWLKFEQGRSQQTAAPTYLSDDGGLSFLEANAGSDARSGDARVIEGRVDLRGRGAVSAWHREYDAGYSAGRQDYGIAIDDAGVEAAFDLTKNTSVRGRVQRAERGDDVVRQAQVAAEWQANDATRWAAEFREVEETHAGTQGTGKLAALRATHNVGERSDVYVTLQRTLDDDAGRYRANDAMTVGTHEGFGKSSNASLELTHGDRGSAAQFGTEIGVGAEHTVYGRYTYSVDGTHAPASALPAGWTAGQRWRVSNQATVFNESQFLKQPGESGLSHTYGLDLRPAEGWRAGITASTANLEKTTGAVDRDAISVSAGFDGKDGEWTGKVEWREDTGAEHRHQWVTTNTATYAVNEDVRLAARVNYANTTDDANPNAGARFAEGNVGLAWRPRDSTQVSLLGKYSFEYDVSSLAQEGEGAALYDQRTQVASLETIWHANRVLELGGKLAHRSGDVRHGRASGEWADSAATLYAVQTRVETARAWHALAEHRWLAVRDGGDERGWLVELDRDIGAHLRAGIGYNFTEFSDDLTDQDADNDGWFAAITGTF